MDIFARDKRKVTRVTKFREKADAGKVLCGKSERDQRKVNEIVIEYAFRSEAESYSEFRENSYKGKEKWYTENGQKCSHTRIV